MSPQAQLQAFTQSVYLVIKGRYFDDITGEDGIDLINKTIDWTNMFLDELETETDTEGNPLDWRWVRQQGATLGTALEGAASITPPATMFNLLTDEGRYVQVMVDGSAVSNWAVVAPDQITNRSDRITEDMVTFTGNTMSFSRTFKDYEAGGTIVGDITTKFPRLSNTNVNALTVIKPKLLLILGVAKNASLPDIVQGGLSPSYAQKYSDLLNNAIARNESGMIADTVERDDYSHIGGVGFGG